MNFKIIGTLLLFISFISCKTDHQEYKADNKNYNADWKSLKHNTPEWFKDAKFGIFIHWGVYSVAAFGNEWYPRLMYLKGSNEYKHHRRYWGDQKYFGYKDFVPLFTAEKFNADEWMDLLQKSGAKFIVTVAEHHDAFAMYNSSYTRWNSVNMGPRRDVLGELKKAAYKKGLKFGASSHLIFNWYYFPHDTAFDTGNPNFYDLYGVSHEKYVPVSDDFMKNWWNRTSEIVYKYQPDLMWFDFCTTYPYLEKWNKKFAAYYYNKEEEWGKKVVINVKCYSAPPEVAVQDIERGSSSKMGKFYWQTDNSISNRSWGYIEKDEFKPVNILIDDLIDNVSKNGSLLLNIGPRPDGTIPIAIRQRLLEIGKWLDINGEAIYGTRPWVIYGEGPTKVEQGFFKKTSHQTFTSNDIRFTLKDNKLYVTALAWPKDEFRIYSLGKKKAEGIKINKITFLGSDEIVKWIRTDDYLSITITIKPDYDHAFPFKLDISGVSFGDIRIEPVSNNQFNVESDLVNVTPYRISGQIDLIVNGSAVQSKKILVEKFKRTLITFKGNLSEKGENEIQLSYQKLISKANVIISPLIKISGDWKYKNGDNVEWKNSKFNDNNWASINLPISNPDMHIDKVEFVWYRKHIMIPEEYRGLDLILPLNKISEVDETFFNGLQIGHSGEFPLIDEGPGYESLWASPREYIIPQRLVKYGEENVIALRIYSRFKPNGPSDKSFGPIYSILNN